MKLLITVSYIITFTLLPEITFSQSEITTLDKWSDQELVMSHFHNNIAKDEEKYHLYDDWRIGDMYLSSGTLIKGFPLRYDLRYNLLEININDEIKVQTINRIVWFTLLEEETGILEEFRSCENYKNEDGSAIQGICKMHSRGKYSLITNIYYVMMEPDYIKAFDVGNKEMKVFVKDRSLLCAEHNAYPKPSGKKAIYRIFGSQSRKAAEFAGQKELNPRKQSDLKTLVDYMNSFEESQ
ncbi:hypothetical protein ACFLU5_07135 [Bacteroidota bacterium]